MVEQTHGPRSPGLVVATSADQRPAAPGATLALERGQRIVATILERLPGGDGYLISLLGLSVVAKSRVELAVGSSLGLEVRSLTPRIELAIVRGAEPVLATAPAALLRSLGDALQSLAQPAGPAQPVPLPPGLMGTLVQLRDGALGAADLQGLHQRLGLFHEARVARLAEGPSPAAESLRTDLKAMLLLAQESAAPEARPALEQALRALDSFDAHEARRSALDAPLLLPLAVLPGGWIREGQLFVAPEQERKESGSSGGRGTKLVFLLDLTKLGPLRVDATVSGDEVSATFRFVRGAAARLVERLLPELRAALAAAGLRPAGLAVERVREGGLETGDLRITVPPPEAPLLDRRV
jgi:hypothetical protein